MRYPLLRGINVGGADRITMAALRADFEAAGDVRTYINSGNVLFTTDVTDRVNLSWLLRKTIQERSGIGVDVQLRDAGELTVIAEAIPRDWINDGSTRCDVVFLQPDVDRAGVIDELGPRPGLEDAIYVHA